jgi:hypothetical protein
MIELSAARISPLSLVAGFGLRRRPLKSALSLVDLLARFEKIALQVAQASRVGGCATRACRCTWFDQRKGVRCGLTPADCEEVRVEAPLFAGRGFDSHRLDVRRRTRTGLDQQFVEPAGLLKRRDIRIIDSHQERGVGVIKCVCTVDQNTGSALTLAKARAESIGATFAIASGANNSTLVTITFPRRPSARGQASAL